RQQQLGTALLLTTHERNLARQCAHRACALYRGALAEENDCAELSANPPPAPTPPPSAPAPSAAPVEVQPDAPVVMRAEQLRVWFPIGKGVFKRTVGHIKAVTDASFTLQSGQTLGIVGESGSGKTTLGLALLRLVESQGLIEC